VRLVGGRGRARMAARGQGAGPGAEVSGAPAGLVSLATVYGVEELLPAFTPGQ